jgi:co-chaperonin GroES (HSP10)
MEIQGKAVLVLPDDNPDKTAKGVIIPRTVKKKPNSGRVVDVGPGCQQVRKGDQIQYARKGGSVIIIDDVEHHFVIEDQIFYIHG